jgi:hypothetical protein
MSSCNALGGQSFDEGWPGYCGERQFVAVQSVFYQFLYSSLGHALKLEPENRGGRHEEANSMF